MNNQQIYDEAHTAGQAAAEKAATDLGTGFVYIKIFKKEEFAKWALVKELALKDPARGIIVAVKQQDEYGTSVGKKEAYAEAFSEVLRKHHISASSGTYLL